jgi:hypothetical protein
MAKKLFKLPDQLDVVVDQVYQKNPQLAKEILAGAEINPLRYFCPNEAQEKVIDTFAKSLDEAKLPVLLFTFANGVGKTTITCHLMMNLILGPQNGWFDYPIFRNWPYPKVIWYCSEAEALRNTVQPEIERLINAEYRPGVTYDKTKDGKTIISTATINGWKIVFKTYDQDPKTYESANVGVIIADEPMPEVLYKAVKSRRRQGTVMLMPMTPLYTPPYVLDEIEDMASKGAKGYYHLTASVYEACKRRGKRGHLDPDIIDEMVASYTPEERRARAFGEFMYFSGSIYPELDEDKHLVEPEDYPVSGIRHVVKMVVDPHDSRPAAAVWMAVDVNNRHIIFAESPKDQERPYWEMKTQPSIEEEAGWWREIERTHLPRDIQKMRIMDKRFGWQTRGKTTLAELYGKEGFYFIPSYDVQTNDGEIAYGHKIVRSLLQDGPDGIPNLLIWKTCQHTWQGLKHYIRRQRTGKTAQDYADSDGVIVEKYKDFPDVVRYGVCQLFLPSIQKTKSEIEKFIDEITVPDDGYEFQQVGQNL